MKFTKPGPRSCGEVAPQLTALFDGEADEAQTRAARAHLLSCPACSRQWLDWTRYRDTFRSEPAPVIPPTLLWRVLIAYRITAFARPARRRSRLPQISAAPLRGIEAPLPPRLSAHILARTTRKPSAHVMLTPLQGAPIAAKSRFKSRDFSFGRAPLWAAPALALFLLMLNRADFNATLPVAAPDTSSIAANLSAPEIAPVVPANAANRANGENAAPEIEIIAPIPVAARSTARANIARSPLAFASAPTAATSPVSPVVSPRRIRDVRRETLLTVQSAPASVARVPRTTPTRLSANANVGASIGARRENGLSRAFAFAVNAGQSDIERARTAPPAETARADARNIALAAPARTARAFVTPPVTIAPRAARPTRVVSTNIAESRVVLAALSSPISAVRTVSSARLRTATFSDGSMRPRVSRSDVPSRRLVRLLPDEDAARLRVSRPLVQKPTLRQANFGNADNGPKIDELRSAVDDFRASIADNE